MFQKLNEASLQLKGSSTNPHHTAEYECVCSPVNAAPAADSLVWTHDLLLRSEAPV